MAKYYVYSLSCPETSKPFYIGKGTGNRIHAHDIEARTRKTCNQAKIDKINSIKAKGLEVIKKKIKLFDDEQEAYKYEADLIRKTPGLTNIVTKEQAAANKGVFLFNVISKIMNQRITRCKAAYLLSKFKQLAKNTRDEGLYLKLIQAAEKLVIKNNYLKTECMYAK